MSSKDTDLGKSKQSCLSCFFACCANGPQLWWGNISTSSSIKVKIHWCPRRNPDKNRSACSLTSTMNCPAKTPIASSKWTPNSVGLLQEIAWLSHFNSLFFQLKDLWVDPLSILLLFTSFLYPPKEPLILLGFRQSSSLKDHSTTHAFPAFKHTSGLKHIYISSSSWSRDI